jgi:hypothetical protein
MDNIHEALLLDGEPNMPFMLSWANEPWSKRWTGLSKEDGEILLKVGQGEEKLSKKNTDHNEKDILLSQDYGDEKEWEEHFVTLFVSSEIQTISELKISQSL